MTKLDLKQIIESENIQKAENLYTLYPIYIKEIKMLIDHDRWLSIVTLLGPTIEFYLREVIKLAYTKKNLKHLRSITFEDFLAEISKFSGKTEISLMEVFSKLSNERKNQTVRSSTKGWKHYFYDYMEQRLE